MQTLIYDCLELQKRMIKSHLIDGVDIERVFKIFGCQNVPQPVLETFHNFYKDKSIQKYQTKQSMPTSSPSADNLTKIKNEGMTYHFSISKEHIINPIQNLSKSF